MNAELALADSKVTFRSKSGKNEKKKLVVQRYLIRKRSAPTKYWVGERPIYRRNEQARKSFMLPLPRNSQRYDALGFKTSFLTSYR